MNLINTSQACAILGKTNGLTKEVFSKRFKLEPVAKQGNGNHVTWFFDEETVKQRAIEIEKEAADKEKTRQIHLEELKNNPAAIAARFTNKDLIERVDRIEQKLDKLLSMLN